MASYRTAARILRGSHLPQLWMGVEASRTQNIEFGIRMLEAAGSACPVDPQVYHEHGVVLYRQGRYVSLCALLPVYLPLTALRPCPRPLGPSAHLFIEDTMKPFHSSVWLQI